jgi:hypothetical protein
LFGGHEHIFPISERLISATLLVVSFISPFRGAERGRLSFPVNHSPNVLDVIALKVIYTQDGQGGLGFPFRAVAPKDVLKRDYWASLGSCSPNEILFSEPLHPIDFPGTSRNYLEDPQPPLRGEIHLHVLTNLSFVNLPNWHIAPQNGL